MNDKRPDPDALLEQLKNTEAQARRGHHKLFFGASAGVGKTYAMLAAASLAKSQGTLLTIGVIETHGRRETEIMVQDLPRLPLLPIEYRGHTLYEFDLDAALRFGHEHPGGLILVDELAHSNLPGTRHPKRWQDVKELLDTGIDVWTTMNVQHLESLNDVVSGITGIRVRETVPDHVFDQADEVVVVDLPPDELLQRLKQGKVYVPHQAERAAQHFFRKGNLLALRELALRRTADRVDGQMQAYRRAGPVSPVWPNRESLLVCVGPGEIGEKLVRSGARLASQLNANWHAVYVERVGQPEPEESRNAVLRVLNLARELGATPATLAATDFAQALVYYAREHNLSRLVMGRPNRRHSWFRQRTLAETIETLAEDLDVLQVALPTVAPHSVAVVAKAKTLALSYRPWNNYIATLALCVVTALIALPLQEILTESNIVMLFLLNVVGVAILYGQGPAMLGAFVGVGLFDFFFVSPRFSLTVNDMQYLLTFSVMLVIALVIGQLTAILKVQAEAANERERRMRRLYTMARDLSAALMIEQVATIGAEFLSNEFNAKSALVVADDDDQLQIMPAATAAVDMGVAQWAFERGEAAGRGTDTLPASPCLVLPLKATMRLRGVIAIDIGKQQGLLTPEQRQLLDTCASLLAISIERIHYIEVARSSLIQMESERLRNSLLSTISHDLRTPLTSLIGLADALDLTQPPPTSDQQDIIAAMRTSAVRMNSLVNNLLDMARLEAGTIHLNHQWQPLEAIVVKALSACKILLAGRPVRVAIAANLPLLHLDATLIERVFVNLLENISCYTPIDTSIDITAQADREYVIVTVDDNGPGLPPGKEEAIFEKFERGKQNSSTMGVGLGLAICRAILHAHGGTIYGETKTTGGARFTLRFPNVRL